MNLNSLTTTRFKVIADYLGCYYDVGDILEVYETKHITGVWLINEKTGLLI